MRKNTDNWKSSHERVSEREKNARQLLHYSARALGASIAPLIHCCDLEDESEGMLECPFPAVAAVAAAPGCIRHQFPVHFKPQIQTEQLLKL